MSNKGEALVKYNKEVGTITFKVSPTLMERIKTQADEDYLRPSEWCLNCIRNLVKEMDEAKQETKPEKEYDKF